MTLRYTGAVDETGAATVNHAAQIKQLFTDLMTTARGILGADWTGAAADAFEQAQHRWNAEADKLTNSQTEIGRLTQRAHQNAMNADHRGAGLF
jgi:WXG100 family type VII secretion target